MGSPARRLMISSTLRRQIETYDLMNLPGLEDVVHYFNPTVFAAAEDAAEDNKRKFEAIGATYTPTSDGRRIDFLTSLPNFAEDAQGEGVGIMINHDTYGGAESLPIGRTYAGRYDAEKKQFIAKFWIDDLDDVPEGRRVIAGIDSGSVTDVSIGGEGKFECSFCGERFGWFGCPNGHYPLMKIMIDADGNETDDPDEMVATEIIYALFVDARLTELSIAYIGAIPDAKITEVYSEVVIPKALELQRCGVNLSQFSCFTPMNRHVEIYKSNMSKQFQLGGQHSMATPTPGGTPQGVSLTLQEAQANNEQLRQRESEYTAKIAELEQQVALFEEIKPKFEALKDKVLELTAANSDIPKLQEQARQGEVLAQRMRDKLKQTKKLQPLVSEEKKNAFYADVDKMTDVSEMFLLLEEMANGTGDTDKFLEQIVKPKAEPETLHHEGYVGKGSVEAQRSY